MKQSLYYIQVLTENQKGRRCNPQEVSC